MRDWYRIDASAQTNTATVHVYEAIGGWFGIDAADFVRELEALDVSTIELYINSPGGIAWDGIAMMNALKRHTATVHVTVEGIAASAASLVAMAGDTITMAEGAQMMIHNGSSMVWGTATDLRAAADVLDKLDADMAAVYQRRAGNTVAHWRAAQDAETWYTADEAVAAGLADATTTDTDTAAEDLAARFDLTVYAYAGRAAAPAPNTHDSNPGRTNQMPSTDAPVTAADLEPITNKLADLGRELASAQLNNPDAQAAAYPWASMGDFLKSIAAGDTHAAEVHAAYTGSTTGDDVAQPQFVRDFIKLVQERRRVVSDFTTGSLPPNGMTVDYVKLNQDTIRVERQINEGDDLPFGKVTFKDGNAPVVTYGGAAELSRQRIERSSTPALNVTLRALALRYARTTNAAVRDELLRQIAAKVAEDATDPDAALELAGDTTDAWLDLVVDAALVFEDRGYDLSRLHVSSDVFKRLIRLRDGDNRLMTVYGSGVNQVGELNLKRVDGSLAGVTVRLLAKAPAGTAAFTDPVAIEFLESPGAPAQLQDENIINLTKQYSIYGYAATLVPFPDAILPIKPTA
ncbi:head maturation protease, ClpP-related [Enemella evansiae]|uniref:head maturation protease, ClpP-related n=1 Tax=Enemella evansiae TaxID=2016499 RepID=UPI0011804184|nr:head maturation protease, ClpP-related [Enemella evansiae]